MRQGKLGRTASARRALFRSSVTNLFIHDRIITTEPKAKEMRPIAEKLITWARKGDLHHRRLAAQYVLEPKALQRLFDEIGPQYAERPGGYTRIVKLGPRRGDAAPLAVIELVGTGAGEKKAKAKK
ncbi:MAG TPA: 50S ribosomal protein L17 [Bacillota bacterium]|nr:50S ribosomal protein L17 [Bacillota bacterium]HNY68780.1 50S ribosomal protein L17 [Bacillota bacterium]HOI37956.1 50S ribosomal protein L17 [Bacillota bacterium]HPU75937.1 50S ribosomal protein L17 [Bacillota bacterium]